MENIWRRSYSALIYQLRVIKITNVGFVFFRFVTEVINKCPVRVSVHRISSRIPAIVNI